MDYSRIAVGVAEECADGIATVDQMTAAFGSAYPEGEDNDLAAGAASSSAHPASNDYDVVAVSRDTATLVAFAVGRENSQPWMQERSLQSQLLRCVVGNPFRPVAVDPPWLTSNVSALALGIYDERAFDRMPILADALEDAGCDDAEMLNHCREPGPHVRGCWVVDLLLGKE